MEDSSNHDADGVVEPVSEVDNCHPEALEPAVGMMFHSVEDIKSFYRKYSNHKGFGWKIRTSKKGSDEQLYYLMLVCSREGSRRSKIPTTLKTLPTIVAKCKAKITARKGKDGVWSIKTVVLNHSHELNPSKSRMIKINNNINMHGKRSIELNDEAEVRLNKTFHTLVQEGGGHANLSFVEDVRNFVNKGRHAIGNGGDAKALLDYFRGMKEQNRNFWYDIDLDDEFSVRSVFWADARSQAVYEAFGDVVSFDTTFLTNKYEVPFAAFVGVNHHGQSILLGGGLVSAEDTESFAWLFECLVRCMSGKPPSGIMTDQCMAIQKAIAIVLPNTRHRWCLWNILKKIPEKLKGHVALKKIRSAMKEVVYETLSKEEFDEKWCLFLKEYELEQNEWLTGLFNDRHKWVPVFLKKDFWAGFSTTQRNESICAFFDEYVNSTTSLQHFVKQYDNALRSMVEKEFEANFQSMNTTIHCGSNSLVEKQFQAEYTHAKFAEVQSEFRGKINCAASVKFVNGTIATYNVVEDIVAAGQAKEVTYEAVLNRDNHEFNCQCLLFEFRGIVCRHSLCVLSLERVKQLPSKYRLARWSKNLKRRHSYIKSSYDATELRARNERYDKLCKKFYEVAARASHSEHASNLLHLALDKFMCSLSATSSQLSNVQSSGFMSMTQAVDQDVGPSPQVVQDISYTDLKIERNTTPDRMHVEDPSRTVAIFKPPGF